MTTKSQHKKNFAFWVDSCTVPIDPFLKFDITDVGDKQNILNKLAGASRTIRIPYFWIAVKVLVILWTLFVFACFLYVKYKFLDKKSIHLFKFSTVVGLIVIGRPNIAKVYVKLHLRRWYSFQFANFLKFRFAVWKLWYTGGIAWSRRKRLDGAQVYQVDLRL